MAELEEQAASAMATRPDLVLSDIKQLMDSPLAASFLVWLADTCRATETVIDENPIIMAAAEGRRQVWVALNQVLSLNYQDIAALRRSVINRARGMNDDE